MIRQKLTHLLFLSLLLGTLPCQAAINDAEAVNRAGQQRMLSQRVAKSYLMIGTDTRTEQALTQLDQSARQCRREQPAVGRLCAERRDPRGGGRSLRYLAAVSRARPGQAGQGQLAGRSASGRALSQPE